MGAPDLQMLYATGRAAGPGVEVDLDTFAEHLAEREDGGEHAADLYLACACLGGDARALEAFVARYLGNVGRYVGKLDASRDFQDEVRQLLYLKLLGGDAPRIADYSGRGPLDAWVRVAATRIGLDLLRARRQGGEVPDEREEQAIEGAVDAELGYLKQSYREVFRAAFRDALRAVPDGTRGLLRLHYVEGVPVERIGTLYGWSRRTAFRRLDDARQALHGEIVGLLRARLAVSPDELESVFRLARSQLELSLTSMVRK
jgi:RNA polymerase sigma-70 factor (ECF subfamily)